ncbi:MAG: DnaJ domain-containing protein [Thermodesulforhabdaceae bacterium]|jgi:DnaJ-class molecular chaperone
MKDYYKILDVPCDASPEAIHEAYRKAVKKYHPDVAGPGSHERFLEVREAYEVLSNPKLRRCYDKKRRGREINAGWTGDKPLWLNGKGYSRVFRGYSDRVVRAELILSNAEAYYGGMFTISVPFNVLCYSCNGLWWLSWYCRECQGNGTINRFVPITVKVPPRTIPGTVIIQECTDPWGRSVQVEFYCRVQRYF